MSDSIRKKRVQPLFHVRAEVTSQRGGVCLTVYGDVLNLSLEGLCFCSPHEAAMNDRLDIYLPLPGQAKTFRTEASVIWVRPHGRGFACGVRFIPPSRSLEAWSDALAQIMASCRSLRGPFPESGST